VAVSNIVSSLGAGSGIDIQALAQNLVDAEKTPRKEALDAKIAKSEARISGLSLVNYHLGEIKNAFDALKDASDFSSLTASNSQPSAFSVSSDSTAQAGNYSINVSQIATSQRSASGAFAERSTVLNAGEDFNVSIAIGSAAAKSITVKTHTPAGVVSAINDAELGVTAQLLNTGDPSKPWTIVVSGETGESKNFTITNDSGIAELNFGTTPASVDLPSGIETTLASLTVDLGTAPNLDLTLTVGSTATPISVTKAAGQTISMSDVVAAINAADLGVTASLVETVDEGVSTSSLVINAPAGTHTNFSLASITAPALDIASTRLVSNLQDAQNAKFKFDGLTISRDSNTVKDVISGVTLELYSATSGNARIDLNRDSTGIKDKLTNLVTAYNDFMDDMKVLGDSSSDVEIYGGAMAGDRFLSTIKAQVRKLVMDTSSSPGTSLKAARDVGIDIDRYGKMSLDETKLESALSNHFSDVVTLFSADTNNQSTYSPLPGGVAGDAFKKIDAMLRSNGTLTQQTDTTNTQIERQKAELAKLEERMTKLLERYTRQFSAMDTLVSSINSERTSLESSMKGLMAAYTNN
jgi:flagellar hook-associated protein 2